MAEARPLAVKICGVTRVEDARAAVEAGADLVGAILSPGFTRSIAAVLARRYVAEAGATLVAVTVDESAEEAAALACAAGASVVQLHGNETPETVEDLRARGSWAIWKAVRVRSGSEVEAAADRWAGIVDALLVEGWHEGQGGGQGSAFPWEEVASARRAFPPGLAFVAAGGLGPANVAAAVAVLAPDVVDVSSGVEVCPGVKAPDRVRAFVQAARAASRPSPLATGRTPE